MKLHLVDYNEEVVDALRSEFALFPEVNIEFGDITAVAQHCLVSPANCHGFMDGGLDISYKDFFGNGIEQTVRDAVARREEKSLPVGAALAIPTGHERVPWFIVAPTMEPSEPAEPVNCYRAMRAILRLAKVNSQIAVEVYCPGLGTGSGKIPPAEAAKMMARAYADWRRSA